MKKKKYKKRKERKKKIYEGKKNIKTPFDGFELLKIIFFVIIFVLGVISAIIYHNKGKHLRDKAKSTIGWVYRRGIRNGLRYRFVIYGKEYHGTSSTIRKDIDDTIRVYYDPDDPDINRSWIDYYEIINDD